MYKAIDLIETAKEVFVKDKKLRVKDFVDRYKMIYNCYRSTAYKMKDLLVKSGVINVNKVSKMLTIKV